MARRANAWRYEARGGPRDPGRVLLPWLCPRLGAQQLGIMRTAWKLGGCVIRSPEKRRIAAAMRLVDMGLLEYRRKGSFRGGYMHVFLLTPLGDRITVKVLDLVWRPAR